MRIFALRDKKAHARTLRLGRSARTEFFSIRFLPSHEQLFFVAVIVGKKVARGAVTRNTIRRRVREYIRRRAQHQEVAGGSAVVFPQKASTPLARGEFYRHLEEALGKAGIFSQSR